MLASMSTLRETADLAPAQTTPTARRGVWTPWSLVLCVECDYADLMTGPRARQYASRIQLLAAMDRAAEVEQSDGEIRAVCNSCHCACWTRYDVALLQRVGFATSELIWEGAASWALEQTGGMCAALVFTHAQRRVVVTAMDDEFVVGDYALTDENWNDERRTWTSAAFYHDGDFKSDGELAVLVKETALKVCEFLSGPTAAVE